MPVVSAGLYAGVSKACILRYSSGGKAPIRTAPKTTDSYAQCSRPSYTALLVSRPHSRPSRRAWRAGLGHASARRCSDPAPDHAAQ